VRQLTLICGVVFLAGITVLGGIVYGRMSRRWGGRPEVEKLAERLRELPEDFGDWHTRTSQRLSPAVETVLECAGYVGRQYENRRTGEVVTFALLLGPAGPISVHTPDVCYSSQQYTIHQAAEPVQLPRSDGLEDALWKTTLQSTGLDGSYLRVYYGWSTGAAWSAPRNARFAFVGKPYLYKIQVVGTLLSPDDEGGSDPVLNFLQALLPVVKPYLLEPPKE
jgi:hypothetical protein